MSLSWLIGAEDEDLVEAAAEIRRRISIEVKVVVLLIVMGEEEAQPTTTEVCLILTS